MLLCNCNDNRTSCCNTPYRVCYNGYQRLNLQPPYCLTNDSSYNNIYEDLVSNILVYNLDTSFATLIQAQGQLGVDNLYANFLAELLTRFNITLGEVSPRLVVTEPDGKVVYDTSNSTSNTYANWQLNEVNPINHNTSMCVMTAQMFPCGVGYESKYSSESSGFQQYVAVRVGPFTNNYGTFRLSVNKE